MKKRTNIILDSVIVDKAKKAMHLKTTKEIVDFALNRLVKTQAALQEVFKLRGKVRFHPSYKYKVSR